MNRSSQRQFGPRRGFTLIEITVVLAIAAVLTALTFGAYADLNASQKKAACQANLQQVYHALRLYMNDYAGAPPLSQTDTPNAGIGLWALYCYPVAGNPTQPNLSGSPASGPPVETYLRKASLLHCPLDNNSNDGSLFISPGIANPFYLSYQRTDSTGDSPPGDGSYTYDPSRVQNESSLASCGAVLCWQDQLLHCNSTCSNIVALPPADQTIVTWCTFHRGGAAGRNYDNVLFYDGSVQYLTNLGTSGLNWQRPPTPPT